MNKPFLKKVLYVSIGTAKYNGLFIKEELLELKSEEFSIINCIISFKINELQFCTCFIILN
ncbi:hypothetical protein RIVM261_001800 [Rivularia sp. IAM M-261]|nr:hypothetical protein CAL7716_054490 [Calothrix sp. PCC 7716]GJD15224.1 hypothetical protein RIVM261_001800 [Rivularia sp. IAM M-261]